MGSLLKSHHLPVPPQPPPLATWNPPAPRRTERHPRNPTRVIDVETADDARNPLGLQLWDQWNLPEVERNEGDDESEASLQVSEPDELPEAPAPTQTSEPASRPMRTRNPPQLSDK